MVKITTVKKILLSLVMACSALLTNAQVPGDTIITSTFNYTQTQYSRDSMILFPDLPGVSFEKIYMLYNMRCKNGLVSPAVSGQTNIGCGEWDYTCNTYIMDSTKTDSSKAKHPSHIITGSSGSTYNYLVNPTYTYYRYQQHHVVNTSTISETVGNIGTGGSTTSAPFNATHQTLKSQYLYTAAELSTAGLSAGNISSIRVQVSNAGSVLHQLKVRMKHTTNNVLQASTPDLNGFTEVYFYSTALVNGINELVFYNPFNWNGTDNVIVEFSFTNSVAGTPSIVLSDVQGSNMGLVSEGDDYHFEMIGSNFMQLGNAAFNNFSNQITIAFWAYGNPNILPANNSVVYGYNAQNHRQVNIHMPWSNSNIYWDCGSGGPYDRINKAAVPAEFEGQWNHYVYTKNSTTGIMNIYLNGALWHTGSGKTIPVEVTDFVLGKAPYGENYYGNMDEFSLWDVELSQADIQTWMYQTINASHPQYTHLKAYYKMNEGNGNTTADVSAATASASIQGYPVWRRFAGKDVFKNFTETNNRPALSFVQGVYTQASSNILYVDSVQNYPNTVYSFVVNNNSIQPLDTNWYYQAGYTFVYDGDNGNLLDSVMNWQTGTINITDLNYFQKFPSAFQLVSFVTPYGINLDLGMGGKTWVFDVTDYAPILKGWKRMFINGGGERQEDMDIKFMFIVGTPPREVKDINNLWRVEPPGYQAIMNDDKYEPRSVPLDPASVSYKIRTAITGHGQEGEFIPRNHYININGGAKEFTWDVWKKCSENPVYPQGGTWIYDRAGWCPGMATDVKEMDITSYVSPGGTALIDYGLDTAWGSSNYWVSNQLVNYGPANFTLDAAVVDIKNPSTKVEYARNNPICRHPQVVIRNTGSTALTSLTIEYWVNNNTVKDTYQWTGNLAFMETAEVSLPASANLWSAITAPSGNVFHVNLRNPNGGSDAYTLNNTFQSVFNITEVVPSNFIVQFKTNLVGAESSYKIVDQDGNLVFQRNNMANNLLYRDTFNLGGGCYSFIVEDTDEDGIDFWANNDGIGYVRFRKGDGSALKIFEPDFGKSIVYNFTVDYPLSYEEIYEPITLQVYPNPARSQFTIEMNEGGKGNIRLFNQFGQEVFAPFTRQGHRWIFQSGQLARGMYYVQLTDERGRTVSKKMILE